MSKKYLYIGGAIVVILFIFSLVMAFRQSPQAPQAPVVNINTSGGQVPVVDPTKNPVEQVGDTVAIAETDQYDIVYYKQEQAFSITLLSQPLQQARDSAEAVFLDKLGVNKLDACKLNVQEAVPMDVDSSRAGRDFGLSFCPNGKPL